MAKKQNKSVRKNSASEVKNDLKDNPLYNYGLVILFFVFLILLTSFKITGDDDVFWHLATGRYIVETHHVPSTDIFGFVTEGQEWMPFEWGWDVITYGLYNIGGYNAILIFRTLIFVLIFLLFFLILRKFKVSHTLIFFFLTLLAFGIIDRLTPRPHIMSLLFFVILLYIIIEYRYFKRENYKILFFIPLIFLLWANIHMGIIAGIFLMGVYVLSEILIFLYPAKFSGKEIPSLTKSGLYRLIIIFVISILVMFINPNTYATYIYAYDHTKMKLLETINEWRSPFDEMFGGGFVTTIYKVFLFGGIVILYYSVKTRDLFAALVFISFAVYSVRAVRFTVDYLIIITIFLTVSVSYIITSSKNEGLKRFFTTNPVPKVALEIILLFFIINLPNDKLYMDHLKYYRVSGFGINSDFIPVQMFDFMKENRIPETGQRPLNHFGSGGYLVWNFPGSKNFIDSRNLNDEIFSEYNTLMAMRPGFENKLKSYDIDYSLYLAPDLVRAPAEMQQSIISYYSKHPDEWKLVFWDDKSFLYVKNLPRFEDVIDKYEYKYVTPYNFLYQKNVLENAVKEDPVRLKEEIGRKLSEDPDGLIINSINSTYSNRLK
ncbi:MAG TPA: hypothetical protein PKC58_05760 [Ignavibacteria bacterium]|nr:hypothetical protein [Ignavibacteria bacterium]